MKPSQQWKLIPAEKGYIVQNTKPASSGQLYMTMRGLGSGEQVVATPYAATWDIQPDFCCDGAVRFCWPTTDFALDLDGGNSDPMTKVQVYHFTRNWANQQWRLLCHETSPEPLRFTQSTPDTLPGHTVSSSVLVSEDSDFRTTVTTTITRTPRFSTGSDSSSTFLPETPTASRFGE
ncbi:hypothetical protein WOLCODRAFT_136629 [Wolfiporia cocos MD-104 SS10]|uniref:Ricin B lectin domain-containing protein n=1 Tax=Wolfiporia cocos (strain MD-104) TaxID=742152 RepID=A0A2H3JCS0_WOLCO|nr:hypothetical protein WOLCODRAFT_136629 [Wolfiporia cocos MD-104 SS10]